MGTGQPGYLIYGNIFETIATHHYCIITVQRQFNLSLVTQITYPAKVSSGKTNKKPNSKATKLRSRYAALSNSTRQIPEEDPIRPENPAIDSSSPTWSMESEDNYPDYQYSFWSALMQVHCAHFSKKISPSKLLLCNFSHSSLITKSGYYAQLLMLRNCKIMVRISKAHSLENAKL